MKVFNEQQQQEGTVRSRGRQFGVVTFQVAGWMIICGNFYWGKSVVGGLFHSHWELVTSWSKVECDINIYLLVGWLFGKMVIRHN